MANKYYTLVTDVGRAKMANAQVVGGKVSFSKIALGSAKTKPNETMTELGKEEWRGNISSVSIAEDNPQWIVIESVVPATVGGFTINEVGLYDEEGDLIVIGNYPETYKPKGDEGTIKDLAIRLIIEVTNAENVDIKVDPSVVIATRKYVDEAITIAMEGIDFSEIEGQLKTHVKDKENPHEVTKDQVGLGNVDNVKQASADDLENHRAEIGTYQDPGHVQLSNAVNSQSSVSDGVASTPRAVKTVNDRVDTLKDNLKSHEATTVYSHDGVHGLRVFDGELQGLNPETGEWGEVDAGGGVKVPLNPIDNLTADAGNARVELTWTDPKDVLSEGVPVTEWDKTVLVRKEGGEPSSIDDGVKVVESSVRNQYKTKPYVDTSVQNEKIYYYRAFAVSKNKLVSDEGANAVQAQPMPYVIYGVEIDENNSDPFGRVKYIEESAGFEPLQSGNGTVKYGSWADKFPLNKVKVVLLKDGKVVEELDKNDYRKTVDGRTVDITSGNNGDVMIGVPLTYWKFNRVGSKLRIYVSDGQPDDKFKAYAHSRNGVVQDDYLYIGAYKGTVKDGKLRSLHDVMSTGDETIGKFRDYAQANGKGYGQMNWATMTLLQIFTVLLSKSTDSQTALGMGYTINNNSFIKNGATVNKGLFYGEQTGKKQMKFLGLEDFYGNKREWVDGLVRKNDKFWVNNGNVNFNNDANGYADGGNAPNFDDYIKNVKGGTDTGFLPSTGNASSSTYYCDYYYYNSGHRVASFGGDRSASDGGARAGAFQLNVSNSPSNSNSYQGARCLFLKEK